MIKLTKSQIKEIADQLDIGMKCYVNKETSEVVSVLDFEYDDSYRELWQDIIDELEKNWHSYVEIEKMQSRDSYKIMADFTETINERELRDGLAFAINKNHPFQNFKWVIDNSGHYRQKWFDYKNKRLIEWVKNQLDVLGFEYEK